MRSWTLPCPAKLNLGLRILDRRPDGYHNLQTVFQLLDYGDELSIATAPELSLNDLPGVAAADNLVLRAARLLRQSVDLPLGAALHLHKRLPAGGGVGGGSSDAASALVGLNAFWKLGLGKDQLAALGLRLGADVPVFVHGHSAFAEGVGERISPLDLPPRWYAVITPSSHVSTAKIFQHKDLTRHERPITVRAFLEGGGINDCEPLVARLYPEVAAALRWLKQFGPARLTGTGASIYAPFESEALARQALAEKPAEFSGFVARGVNQSPLWSRLQQLV